MMYPNLSRTNTNKSNWETWRLQRSSMLVLGRSKYSYPKLSRIRVRGSGFNWFNWFNLLSGQVWTPSGNSR